MKIKDYVKARTTSELQDELNALNWNIDHGECFGTSDLILIQEIQLELELRKCAICEEIHKQALENGICNTCFILEKEGGING